MTRISEAELVARFPNIAWREPIPVSVTTGARALACRICVAQLGLGADQVLTLPRSMEEHARHLAEARGGGSDDVHGS